MADFGWKEGYAQLGSYRNPGNGLLFIYVLRGDPNDPAAGTVEAWIAAAGPYTDVRMVTEYDPVYVRGFPTRAAVQGGVACSWPSVEADALVAAGVAAYA